MFEFLDSFSDNTKVWLYQSPRLLTAEEKATIEQQGNEFVQGWATHGKGLKSTIKIVSNRFVIVAADQDYTANSGCSIDSLVRFIKHIENQFKLNLMDRMLVFYEDAGIPTPFHFNDLSNLTKSGIINDSTVVYNPLVNNKTELLSNWKQPLSKSWLAAFA